MSDPIKVRTVPALPRPSSRSFYREFGDIFRNPTALIGGLVGTGAFMGGAVAFVMFGPAATARRRAGGRRARHGVHARRAGPQGREDGPGGHPGEDHRRGDGRGGRPRRRRRSPPTRRPPEPRAEEERQAQGRHQATEKPDPNKKGAKESDKNREGNKQYKDMPTVKDLPGDPFGSPNGWSDMAKDGDPWATAVLAALNGMKVGAYAGQGKAADLQVPAGGLRRRLGRPHQGDAALRRHAAGRRDQERDRVAEAAEGAAGDRQAAGWQVQAIPYDFTWSGKGTPARSSDGFPWRIPVCCGPGAAMGDLPERAGRGGGRKSRRGSSRSFGPREAAAIAGLRGCVALADGGPNFARRGVPLPRGDMYGLVAHAQRCL
jgi:hypothetical protein